MGAWWLPTLARKIESDHRKTSCQGGQILKRLSNYAFQAGMHRYASQGCSLGLALSNNRLLSRNWLALSWTPCLAHTGRTATSHKLCFQGRHASGVIRRRRVCLVFGSVPGFARKRSLAVPRTPQQNAASDCHRGQTVTAFELDALPIGTANFNQGYVSGGQGKTWAWFLAKISQGRPGHGPRLTLW